MQTNGPEDPPVGQQLIDSMKWPVSRRSFVAGLFGSAVMSMMSPARALAALLSPDSFSKIFWVKNIPAEPFTYGSHGNWHAGVESLLALMSRKGLKFYRSATTSPLAGPDGMIAANDVVLIKVNACWKYRGITNSDVVRGLVQRILDHPDGYSGEVVICDNGQGAGNLKADRTAFYPDGTVQANANDPSHSFQYLIDTIFNDPRVSGYEWDTIMMNFIDEGEHSTDGYRNLGEISYPCFTTQGGRRVELRDGIWNGTRHTANLKLINVPVLKHHDAWGSFMTGAVKNFYGVLTMADGAIPFGNITARHYTNLGQTCGRMITEIRPAVLNIVDAIWVSHGSIFGYPASATFRANQLMASQDPVALDYRAAKWILYPHDRNPHHHPTYPVINGWLKSTRQTINSAGGIYRPKEGLMVGKVTLEESKMAVFKVVLA